MPSPRPDDEDIHNPFGGGGGQTPVSKKPNPGVFDDDFEGVDDPFTPTDEERDAEWDEQREEPGTSDA